MRACARMLFQSFVSGNYVKIDMQVNTKETLIYEDKKFYEDKKLCVPAMDNLLC
jgi:hypothetical protein